MRLFDLLFEGKKEELIAQKMGDQLIAARSRDNHANQDASAEDIVNELLALDPTNGKYLQWLANRYKTLNFRMEDANRVTTALRDFNIKKKDLEKKDINQYKSLSELEDAVESTDVSKSKRQQKQEIKTQGADVLYRSPEYTVVELKTKEAACFYGSNTKWCTAAKNHNAFDTYNDGPLYVIIDHKNDRKYQIQYESGQFMNERDEPVDYRGLEKNYPFLSKLEKQAKKRILSSGNFDQIISYARDIIKGRWPEAEPVIMKNPIYAYAYASNAIKGRWPEAEPYIMKDLNVAYEYARDIIEGRWPEAEPYIMKSPKYAYFYSFYVIKSRWPEAEPYIMKDPYWSMRYKLNFGIE